MIIESSCFWQLAYHICDILLTIMIILHHDARYFNINSSNFLQSFVNKNPSFHLPTIQLRLTRHQASFLRRLTSGVLFWAKNVVSSVSAQPLGVVFIVNDVLGSLPFWTKIR